MSQCEEAALMPAMLELPGVAEDTEPFMITISVTGHREFLGRCNPQSVAKVRLE